MDSQWAGESCRHCYHNLCPFWWHYDTAAAAAPSPRQLCVTVLQLSEPTMRDGAAPLRACQGFNRHDDLELPALLRWGGPQMTTPRRLHWDKGLLAVTTLLQMNGSPVIRLTKTPQWPIQFIWYFFLQKKKRKKKNISQFLWMVLPGYQVYF